MRNSKLYDAIFLVLLLLLFNAHQSFCAREGKKPNLFMEGEVEEELFRRIQALLATSSGK